ncbi:MAG: DUF5916 domain-containing protein [Fidelibacterota bacterium]
MKRTLFFMILLFWFNLPAKSFETKEYEPQKFNKSPKIDGIINEPLWQQIPELTGFIQYYPQNGSAPKYQTRVKIFYSDNSIFVAAEMHDEYPDSINRELGPRDSFESVEADLFAINISPYNDGVNSYGFMVSAAGVQSDINFISSREDKNWDAVWNSAVQIHDNGWSVEIELPYSALRFPKQDNQTWGINFFRMIKRENQWSTWNYLDINDDIWWANMGQLKNLRDIDPPLRLSFIPYISSYLEHNTDNEWGTIYNGGLDLKYGINESFTLDMTLIPDFKQAQSDNVVLNLSPFEIQYDEKRQFFIEGMELFNRGSIFYTRRVGGSPVGLGDVENTLSNSEVITNNPTSARLINSTKFSGRTKGGLGIGIFNGLTDYTTAIVKDTLTGEKREITTQDMTNYNMVVLDQTLPNKSYFSIANTNVLRKKYWADALSTEFKLNSKNMQYSLEGLATFSNKFFEDSTNHGQRYRFEAGKMSGKLQYEYQINLETDTFDINDMGFVRQNNEIENEISLDYNIYETSKYFIEQHYSIEATYVELYKPKKFRNFRIDQSFSGTFKNLNQWSYHAAWQPQPEHDYFEAREENRLFIKPALLHICSRYSTAQKRRFRYTIFGGYNYFYSDFHDYIGFGLMFSPKYRINTKASLGYEIYYWNNGKERGFVEKPESTGEIIFGQRRTTETTHTVNAKYTLNEKSNIDFRLRHYYSNADYNQYFTLKDNGYLKNNPNYAKNADINYNAFNIDFVYSWNFAPGSFLNIVWKNSIYQDGERIYHRWYDNLENTLQSSQTNSFSMKLLYYFDYGKIL